MQTTCSLLLFLVITFAQSSVRLDPLVHTNVGLIQGLPAEDGDYSMFLGIPYGKVDERNPFGIASPHPNFEDTFEAFDDSAICPQLETTNYTITGTLDCLHLNVFVPNSATSINKLPVLLWVHGGALARGNFGRYTYGPKFLVAHEVILVTINYRVNVYGFMCLDTPEIPGNQGLKDQYLAIQWVYDNIEAFGGNRDEITVMGESAGSKTIELHLLSHRSYLFKKVILQSGSPLGPDVVDVSDQTAPLKIAEHLGLVTDDINSAIAFLASHDPKLVVASHIELGLEFRVCVEKSFDKVDPFVTQHPEHGDFSKAKGVSILAGFNSHELLSQYNNKNNFVNPNFFEDWLKFLFEFDSQDMPDLMRQFYVGDNEISEELIWEQIDFWSDYMYNYAIQRSLDRYFESGGQDIYQYKFSYSGERNMVKRSLNITVGGAAHADELGYLFDQSYVREIPNTEDQLMIDRMTTLWTNFVKYGNPTPETSDILPIKWLPKTKDVSHYLDINLDLKLRNRPYHERLTFWELYYKTNEAQLKANSGYFNK